MFVQRLNHIERMCGPGTQLFGRAVSVWAVSVTGRFGLAVSVWGQIIIIQQGV